MKAVNNTLYVSLYVSVKWTKSLWCLNFLLKLTSLVFCVASEHLYDLRKLQKNPQLIPKYYWHNGEIIQYIYI